MLTVHPVKSTKTGGYMDWEQDCFVNGENRDQVVNTRLLKGCKC